MDWKRTMNKRSGKADEKNAEVKEEIEQFFAKLLPEINLRLLLDMEIMAGNRILWVESVTVTACQNVKLLEKAQEPGIIRIWKRLIGALADIVPLRNL